MPVYTVHAPSRTPSARAGDRVVFVRDGFHVWAFLFGALWLIAHRLWLAALGYAALVAALALGLSALHVGRGAAVLAFVALALLLGFEAATLRRWTLARRGFRTVDVVVADGPDRAERRFFERWPGSARLPEPRPERSAPPAVRPVLPGDDVFGAFPRAGGAA